MKRELFAVCPRCGKRAGILSYRWDWDREQDYAKIRCVCGISEVPFDENRIVDIDLDNPYMEEAHFRLLMPAGAEKNGVWNKIGGCLMRSWAEEGGKPVQSIDGREPVC